MKKIKTLDGYLKVEEWYENAAEKLMSEYNKRKPNELKMSLLEKKMKDYEKMLDDFQNSGKFNDKEYNKICGDFQAFH